MTLYIDTKPTLEWVEIGEALVAEFGLGRYEILWIGDTYIIRLNGNRIPHHYPFKDVAIAAAQADYERRTAERFVKVDGLFQSLKTAHTQLLNRQYKYARMTIGVMVAIIKREESKAAIDRAKEK